VAHVFSVPASTDKLVGASGAIAGVPGAYLMLHPQVEMLVLLFRRVPVLLPAYLLIGGWLLLFMSFSASFLRELLRPDPTNQSCVGGAPARIGSLS
jgi:membrane associated rhomboid family serine protease